MTPTQQAAMRVAIDAFQTTNIERHVAAIGALRAALAEPVVDQDTWVFACDLCGKPVPEGVDPWHFSTHTSRHSHACDECVDSVPIFEAQQPVEVPLLTAAEILAIMRGGNNCNYNDEGEHVDFARAVEQAVRQKAGIK